MYRWIKAFLTELFIRTRIKGTLSRTRPLADGLPQGSALSCTLFLIFMNNIGNAVRTPNRPAYADDTVLWHQDTDIDKATEAINMDLASLKRFCERWKMQINTGKNVYTTFSLSNPVQKKALDIRIGNDSLQRDDLPRYLGVSLDPRLCLRRHIEEVANSVRERIRILQKLAGSNWGATSQSLRTIYVSFIRPVLEYANPVLNLASRTSLEKLDRVQNVTLRLVFGLYGAPQSRSWSSQSDASRLNSEGAFRPSVRPGRFGREHAIAHTDGSSTGGTGNGGYGIYILWPDGSTTRKCGPVGEWTCSYECELMAVTECLPVIIEKQREGAALPGVVMLTDCRVLVQALGGSGSEGVGEAVLLADYLLKSEGVWTMVQ
ncbi:RNA-directed DNA polymerase from mobile element jockey-like [Plakobranchus ocellatus]|uniref:RNA-directed DNA polymerase from mobile element jockey-like n=1 Tax=Plakobranchus ocellatus TaxID=259542 RepID=A0AAV3YD81_9GAST|nr:RNA-directed DNA polymerase from mobile element jockey-like [Plakobranchus ocellatus]